MVSKAPFLPTNTAAVILQGEITARSRTATGDQNLKPIRFAFMHFAPQTQTSLRTQVSVTGVEFNHRVAAASQEPRLGQ